MNAAVLPVSPATPATPSASPFAAALAPGAKPSTNPFSGFVPTREWLPKVLIERQLLPEHEVLEAVRCHDGAATKACFGTTLLTLELIGHEALLDLLSEFYGFNRVNLSTLPDTVLNPSIFEIIHEDTCVRHNMLAWFVRADGTLNVVMSAPTAAIFTEVKLASSSRRAKNVVFHLATEAAISAVLREFSVTQRLDAEADTPVSREIAGIIREGINEGASDICFEPGPRYLRVRLRVDGRMRTIRTYLDDEGRSLNKRSILIRATTWLNLNAGDTTVPADTETEIYVRGRLFRMRVNLTPTDNGSSIVVRLLDAQTAAKGFEELGIEPDHAALLQQAARQQGKMVLAVGPTGAGKSTTLYALVAAAGTIQNKVLTIEDPPEYRIPFAQQVRVQAQKVTFAGAIRAAMRQNPNIIVVGEIRDQETASVALTASLTGHAVYSSVHGQHGLMAVARLLDWGLDAAAIADRLCLVMAQRLVRRVCRHCRRIHSKAEATKTRHGLPKEATIFEADPRGCPHCIGGYRGRIGIFEFIPVDHQLAEIIAEHKTQAVSRGLKYAREVRRLRTMRDDGMLKACRGETTVEEVVSATFSMADEQTTD